MENLTSVTISGVTESAGLGDLLIMETASYLKIVYSILSAIGLPGNLLTVVVILYSSRMRKKPFNMFIIHQSCIDFLSCLVTLLLQFYNSTAHVSESGADIYCRIWVSTSLQWILMLCSSYNLTAMSIERHQAITKPLKHDDQNVNNFRNIVKTYIRAINWNIKHLNIQ